MSSGLQNVLFALVISLAMGVFAFRKEALSKSGTLAAVLLGAVVFIFGGIAWFAVLAVFFLTSVFFTSFKAREKGEVVKDFAKGGVRDFWQVLANGGIAGILAFASSYYHTSLVFYAFLGVMATVTADTWATELGILQRQKPRLITTWQPVPVGTSGAVSGLGILIALAGALLIGASAVFFLGYFGIPVFSPLTMVAIAGLAGLGGALADSFLGATAQAMYYCTACRKETEKTIHSCGHKTVSIRGVKWFDNDFVNLASSAFGALAAAGLYLLVR